MAGLAVFLSMVSIVVSIVSAFYSHSFSAWLEKKIQDWEEKIQSIPNDSEDTPQGEAVPLDTPAVTFEKNQEEEIQKGREFGLPEDLIAMYARPEFSAEQMRWIRDGLEYGLPKEKVAVYASPKFSPLQMAEIYHGLTNLSIHKVLSYAKPELSPFEMRQIRKRL